MCRGIPASQAPAFRIMMMAMMIIAIIAIIIIIITTTHRCIVSAIHAIIQVFVLYMLSAKHERQYFPPLFRTLFDPGGWREASRHAVPSRVEVTIIAALAQSQSPQKPATELGAQHASLLGDAAQHLRVLLRPSDQVGHHFVDATEWHIFVGTVAICPERER